MALAQGLSTNLIEIAWKSHLHMLHPSPAAYSVSSASPTHVPAGEGVDADVDATHRCAAQIRGSAWPSLLGEAGRERSQRHASRSTSVCASEGRCEGFWAQAFLGEVATWTGIVTGTLMFASPALFARCKWKGVAGATPAFMLWTGVPFFVGCMLYNVAHPTQGVGTAALRALVIVGAILQVLLHA